MDNDAVTKQDLKAFEIRFDKKFVALTELVAAGFQTMNERFDRLGARIDELENQMKDLAIRVGALEVGQREMNVRLDRLDGRIVALHDDVVELYRRSTETRRKFAGKLKALPEQDRRLKRLERFAASAARRLGLTLAD